LVAVDGRSAAAADSVIGHLRRRWGGRRRRGDALAVGGGDRAGRDGARGQHGGGHRGAGTSRHQRRTRQLAVDAFGAADRAVAPERKRADREIVSREMLLQR